VFCLTVSFCDIPDIKAVNIVGNRFFFRCFANIFFAIIFPGWKKVNVIGNACTEEHVKVAMVARAQILLV
jgi:hypothetical protein